MNPKQNTNNEKKSEVIKKGRGRPKGATVEKFSIKKRLKVLKKIALNEKAEDRIRLAAIDLYTKISGDSLKPITTTENGSIVRFEFTHNSPTITNTKESWNVKNASNCANNSSVEITAPINTPYKSDLDVHVKKNDKIISVISDELVESSTPINTPNSNNSNNSNDLNVIEKPVDTPLNDTNNSNDSNDKPTPITAVGNNLSQSSQSTIADIFSDINKDLEDDIFGHNKGKAR